jgi:uncharacterized iron-regulated membrane protein
MFEPTFDDRVSILGLDPLVIMAMFSVLVAIAYVWWIRRVIDIEPDVHSFRSTAPARPNVTLRAGLALAFVAAALAAIAAPR